MAQLYSVVLLLFLWSQVELTITHEACSQLPTVEHAFVSVEYQKDYYERADVIYFSCVSGFTTGFNTSYICSPDGWRGQTIGQCIEVDSFPVRLGCAPPTPPKNGRLSKPSFYFYGHSQKAELECDPGFTMRGERSTTCSNGRWSGDVQCLGDSDMLQELSTQLSFLQTQMEELKKINQEQASKLRELQNKTDEVDSIKEQLRDQAVELRSLMTDREAGRVAFSASLLASGKRSVGPFDTDTILKYENVITNFGNAYDPDTGRFTAPVRGVYHMEFHFATGDGSPASYVELMMNGSVMCTASERPSNNEYGTTGNGVSLLLDAGDQIYLNLRKTFNLYDNRLSQFSTFSGRLLFPA